jgi:hypothetical protein
MRRRNWIRRGLKFVLTAVLFVVVIGFATMGLWNWLMPTLFGWQSISFSQAVGRLVLSKIFFGGFRGGRPGVHKSWRGRMKDRWEAMTPEERERFGKGMQGRCRSFGPPLAEPKV